MLALAERLATLLAVRIEHDAVSLHPAALLHGCVDRARPGDGAVFRHGPRCFAQLGVQRRSTAPGIAEDTCRQHVIRGRCVQPSDDVDFADLATATSKRRSGDKFLHRWLGDAWWSWPVWQLGVGTNRPV